MEALALIPGVARHGFGDGQTAGFRSRINRRGALGVGERGGCHNIRCDCSAIAGFDGGITVLISLGLCDLVGNVSREASRRLALVVLQREGGFTIGKGHAAILAADGRIIEDHCKVEVLALIPGVARHGFGDGQAAGCQISLVIRERCIGCFILRNLTADYAGVWLY